MTYRHAYEDIPAQVWTAARDGMLSYVNAETVRFMGVPDEDLLGTGWANVVHPQDIVMAAPRWQHSVATGAPYEQLFRLRKGSDQRYYWFLSRANAVRDELGRISHWVGVNTGIDGISLAQDMGRVVFDANSLQATVFEQLPVALVVLTGAGLRVQRATASARSFAALANVEQQPLLAAYPQLRGLCESGLLAEVMTLGEGRRIAEIPFDRDDGAVMAFDVVCEPLRDASGGIEGMTLAFLPA